jgi:5-formyltetrahydrofolate cyclo-ligase
VDTAAHDLALTKARFRRDVRARRAARDGTERTRLAELLRDVVLACPLLAGARTVACYASVGAEPGTGPLRAALAEAGLRVLLPVVVTGEDPVRRLDWADDGPLAPGPLGTVEPTGPRLGPDALARADLVLVPALLVDTGGHRLGQGGGFYDVTLGALVDAPPVVALVHDDELVDADVQPVPAGRLDRPVDAAATPARWWSIPRRA